VKTYTAQTVVFMYLTPCRNNTLNSSILPYDKRGTNVTRLSSYYSYAIQCCQSAILHDIYQHSQC